MIMCSIPRNSAKPVRRLVRHNSVRQSYAKKAQPTFDIYEERQAERAKRRDRQDALNEQHAGDQIEVSMVEEKLLAHKMKDFFTAIKYYLLSLALPPSR
jgi:hypothetical protein